MILLKDTKQVITNSRSVTKIFQDLLATEDDIDREKEHLYIMHLDARNRIKMVELVAMGAINGVNTYPREVFRRAIVEGSVAIIIAHNHPSGEVTPSDDDIRFTKRIHEAGEVLGIPLTDHIVFSLEKAFSFKEDGEIV